PAEIEAFMNDASPDAYEKLIDNLLASPLYGQRWARHWLDVVRYADTLYENFLTAPPDSRPSDISDAWRYRDWVVNAFNKDLPYDQFVIQQFAGDLLPVPEFTDPADHPAVATGVFAIGEFGAGDADKEKLVTDIADDQVDLTSRAFLGLTISCARCHDHKFDPISTADYYSLAGIFFSSRVLSDQGPKGAEVVMQRTPLASPAELQRRKQREERIAELGKNIQTVQDERIAALAQAMLPQAERYLAAAGEFQTRQYDGATTVPSFAAEQKLDPIVLDRLVDFLEVGNLGLFSTPVPSAFGVAGMQAWTAGPQTPAAFVNSTNGELIFQTIKLPAHRLAVHPSPTTGVAVAWKSPIAGPVQVRGRIVDVDNGGGDGIAWELVKITGTTSQVLAQGAFTNGGMETIGGEAALVSCDVKPGELLQLNVLPKGDYTSDSTMLEAEIVETGGQNRTWDLNQDVVADFLTSNPHADRFGNADIWYFRDLAVLPPAPLVAESIKAGSDDRFAAPGGVFWAPLRNEPKAYPPETAASLAAWKPELSQLNSNPPPPLPTAHGLQEGGIPNGSHPGIHDVKIHIRGHYGRLGETVPRRFPQVLAGDEQKPITEGSGRLQLAKWIASAENPLTARVMVNRIWQHHFGEGIVRTPNNYGKMGIPPTHPALLDQLAIEFVRSGWSMKAMHRMMMLSATYRQSSEPPAEALKVDPGNELFGWMNRRKLEAEALRDALLFTAGQLDATPGGRATDNDTLRRTLYVVTNRADRSNYRSLFDAADSGAIVEKRTDSIVAPQALFLMNHPFALERAKQLAERASREGGADDTAKIDWLYRTLFARPADAKETEIGLNFLAAKLPATTQATTQATTTPANPQNPAWQAYCQVLLCANEFMYVD
ncbi:MAG: DUF1549 and DUF1553 domain-containing protein, partial [Tepidisphaeraceae bacterium]